jgi:hypothetical protein
MKDFMDQWTKTMEGMWNPWQKMMTDFPWKPETAFKGKWSAWVAALRSGYETNVSWWQTCLEQSEEMFFKTFKDAPAYNPALENQIRDLWDIAKKAQKTQQDVVRDQLQKMESLLREKEEA